MKTCVLLLILSVSVEGHLRLFHQNVAGRKKTYFYETGVSSDFEGTNFWCRQLGGRLPIIHTTDDLSFLTGTVVSGANANTWLGLRKEGDSCSEWMDGTKVNITFNWITNARCENCFSECCAMYVTVSGHMGFASCSTNHLQVCVLDGSSMDPLTLTNKLMATELAMEELQEESNEKLMEARQQLDKTMKKISELEDWVNKHGSKIASITATHDEDMKKEVDDLKKKSSTSNALLWTILSIMTVLIVIMGFISYCSRRNPMPVFREDSVAYIANEDRLNFNSAGPSSPSNNTSNNTSRKTNNLYRGERDECGAP